MVIFERFMLGIDGWDRVVLDGDIAPFVHDQVRIGARVAYRLTPVLRIVVDNAGLSIDGAARELPLDVETPADTFIGMVHVLEMVKAESGMEGWKDD